MDEHLDILIVQLGRGGNRVVGETHNVRIFVFISGFDIVVKADEFLLKAEHFHCLCARRDLAGIEDHLRRFVVYQSEKLGFLEQTVIGCYDDAGFKGGEPSVKHGNMVYRAKADAVTLLQSKHIYEKVRQLVAARFHISVGVALAGVVIENSLMLA